VNEVSGVIWPSRPSGALPWGDIENAGFGQRSDAFLNDATVLFALR